MTSTVDVAELERLARAATPGPWMAVYGGRGMEVFRVIDNEQDGTICRWTGDHPLRRDNLNFIAAANPAAILSLIAALKEAEALNIGLVQSMAEVEGRAERVTEERGRLRSQVEWLERNSVLRSPAHAPISEYLAAKLSGEQETPCPSRIDRQHCSHWYDGGPCCGCGDAALLSSPSDRPAEPVAADCAGTRGWCALHQRPVSECWDANEEEYKARRSLLIQKIISQLDMNDERQVIELNAKEIADIVISMSAIPPERADRPAGEKTGKGEPFVELVRADPTKSGLGPNDQLVCNLGL